MYAGEVEATGWGCQPDPAAKKRCQGLFPQAYLPPPGPNLGCPEVGELGLGTAFCSALASLTEGKERGGVERGVKGRGDSLDLSSCELAREGPRRRGSSPEDVWLVRLVLPCIRVAPLCSMCGSVWHVLLQIPQVYVFVRSTCCQK